MKRLPIIIRRKTVNFLFIIIAVIVGNLISQLLIADRQTEKLALEEKLFAKLDKLEKETRHQTTYAEQAHKESARLQQVMEYHQRMMERVKNAAPAENIPHQ